MYIFNCHQKLIFLRFEKVGPYFYIFVAYQRDFFFFIWFKWRFAGKKLKKQALQCKVQLSLVHFVREFSSFLRQLKTNAQSGGTVPKDGQHSLAETAKASFLQPT